MGEPVEEDGPEPGLVPVDVAGPPTVPPPLLLASAGVGDEDEVIGAEND